MVWSNGKILDQHEQFQYLNIGHFHIAKTLKSSWPKISHLAMAHDH